jgi:hypothetical protein
MARLLPNAFQGGSFQQFPPFNRRPAEFQGSPSCWWVTIQPAKSMFAARIEKRSNSEWKVSSISSRRTPLRNSCWSLWQS